MPEPFVIDSRWLVVPLVAAVALGACERKAPDGRSASTAPVAPETVPPPDPAMVAAGEQIFAVRQCASCHTTDGSPGMGPTLAGIYGKRQSLIDKREVVVDIPYLRRSLIDPQADVVPGFTAQMLNYKDVLSEKDIAALVAYIRTLKVEEDEATPASGSTGGPGTPPAGH